MSNVSNTNPSQNNLILSPKNVCNFQFCMDLKDLNCGMSSLIISTKRRRQSGFLGLVPNFQEDQDSINTNNTFPDIPLKCTSDFESNTTNPDLNSSLQPSETNAASPILASSPNMGKIDPKSELPVRRSSRKKSVINPIDIPLESLPTTTNVQEFDIATDLKHLKKIYLDKRVRKTAPSLETIFETPTDEKVMSLRKFRRFISFQEQQKGKVRKRPLKAKETVANYNKLKRKSKVSMDALMQKLNSLEND